MTRGRRGEACTLCKRLHRSARRKSIYIYIYRVVAAALVTPIRALLTGRKTHAHARPKHAAAQRRQGLPNTMFGCNEGAWGEEKRSTLHPPCGRVRGIRRRRAKLTHSTAEWTPLRRNGPHSDGMDPTPTEWTPLRRNGPHSEKEEKQNTHTRTHAYTHAHTRATRAARTYAAARAARACA